MPEVQERVVRLRIDFGQAQQDTKAVSDNIQGFAGAADTLNTELGKVNSTFRIILVSLGLVAAAMTAVSLAVKAGVLDMAAFSGIGATIIGVLVKMKAGFLFLTTQLTEALHSFHLLDVGLVSILGPIGVFVTNLVNVGSAAELAKIALHGLGVTIPILDTVLTTVVATTLGMVAAMNAAVVAAGFLATAIGTKLTNAANEWLETGKEFEKQQFNLEIAVKAFGKTAGGTALNVDDLVHKIREISVDTGLAVTDIKFGVNTMLEMSKVTKLTADQIDALVRSMADFATQRDVSFQEVVYAVDQSFRGWNRSAMALGLTLDDTSVKMLAANKGWSQTPTVLGQSVEVTNKYKAALAGMEYALGASAQAADKTLFGAMRKLNGQIEVVNGTLGQGVAQFWLPFYKIINNVTSAFRGISEPILKAIGFITALSGAILLLIGQILKWTAALLTLYATFQLFSVAGRIWTATIEAMIPILDALIRKLLATAVVQQALTQLFKVNITADAASAVLTQQAAKVTSLRGAWTLLLDVLQLTWRWLLRLLAPLKAVAIAWTVLAGFILLAINAFKEIATSTEIFTDYLKALAAAFKEFGLAIDDAGGFLSKWITLAIQAGTLPFIVLISAAITPFILLAKAMLLAVNAYLQFKKYVLGSDVEDALKRNEEAQAGLTEQLLKVGGAADKYIDKLAKSANATKKEADEVVGLKQAEIDSLKAHLEMADVLDGEAASITKAAIQWKLLEDQLVKAKVGQQEIARQSQQFWAEYFGTTFFAAIQGYERSLNKSTEAFENAMERRYFALKKNGVEEADALEIIAQEYQKNYDKINDMIEKSIADRAAAQSGARQGIQRVLGGDQLQTIAGNQEVDRLNSLIDLNQKLYEIKKLGYSQDDPVRIKLEGELRAKFQAEEIQREIKFFDERKKAIIEVMNLRKNAAKEAADAEADYITTALQANHLQYDAEKFAFDRRKALLVQETAERIFEAKNSAASVADQEKLITTAVDRESAIRKKIAVEEGLARKRAIEAAAEAGKQLGSKRSDLEIIQRFGIRPLSLDEQNQLAEERRNTVEQRKIEAARNPLAQSPFVAVQAVNQIQEQRRVYSQGIRAALDLGPARGGISQEQATSGMRQLNQVTFTKLQELAEEMPQFVGVFSEVSKNLSAVIPSAEELQSDQERMQNRQLEALDAVTKASNLLAQEMVNLRKAIEVYQKSYSPTVPTQPEEATPRPLTLGGTKYTFDLQKRDYLNRMDVIPGTTPVPTNQSAYDTQRIQELVQQGLGKQADLYMEYMKTRPGATPLAPSVPVPQRFRETEGVGGQETLSPTRGLAQPGESEQDMINRIMGRQRTTPVPPPATPLTPALPLSSESAPGLERFPASVETTMKSAQDIFQTGLVKLKDQAEAGFKDIGISFYQMIVDKMDKAMDDIKSRT